MSIVKNVKVEPSYRSDHSPVILELTTEEKKRGKPLWRFNNSVIYENKYVDKIKEVILDVKKQYAAKVYNLEKLAEVQNDEIVFQIDDQLFFEVLLMEIRAATISYCIKKKKEENALERTLIEEINLLEADINELNVPSLEGKKEQLQQIRNKRIEGMKIRSRSQWLLEGEKVTKYFCNLENRNFVSKSMSSLELDDGEMIYDNNDLLEETKRFYENLYSCRQSQIEQVNLDTVVDNIPTLNQEDCEMIEGRITVAEAKVALSGMKNNKSPGSDGYTVEFFKFFFSDLGHFLVRSVNLGFTRQQLSVTQKQGIITCIPKDGKPKQLLKNWRPISLLNVSYKITSACIANRIKIMLPKIIHTDQRGFMKERYIGENIRMLYDVLVQTEKEKIPGMLLLIDFEKAFDSVSWTFMQNALLHFNFGPDIRQWIKTFYNDVSTCVTVNGHLSRWFHIKRGVRQGDPLSPYLFLICAEVMSTMIRENDRIKGIKIRDYDVLLNQFADDTSLCLAGSEESLEEAVRVLERFAGLSGLKMNMDKTQIIWIGSRKNSGIRFLRDKNFCWDPGIFKVLGVKFTTNIEQISNLNFENKIQEIKQLLASWNRRLITPFGKNNCTQDFGCVQADPFVYKPSGPFPGISERIGYNILQFSLE